MNSSALPVSVVIPCYRSASTIDRAFDSVLAQTRRPAEVILIDDASGDGTLDRLQELQTEHGAEWIKLVSLQTNRGPAAARNAGWDQATQDYVAFLDADDAWHPRKLEIQYAWMAAHADAGITGHAWTRATPGQSFQALPADWSVTRVSPTLNLLSNRFPTLSVMIRRDVTLRFDPRKRLSEDYLLWCQMLLSGIPGHRIELPLAHRYKRHHGGDGRLSDLWAMEKAEQATFARLKEQALISPLTHALLVPFSFAKYLKRLLLHLAP